MAQNTVLNILVIYWTDPERGSSFKAPLSCLLGLLNFHHCIWQYQNLMMAWGNATYLRTESSCIVSFAGTIHWALPLDGIWIFAHLKLDIFWIVLN